MLDRRSLLGGCCAAAVAGSARAAGPALLRLWPDAPPGGGGPSGPVHVTANGAVSNVSAPSLAVFIPARPNGAAVLVAAGGGYKRVEIESEAHPAARWLVARGIAAFVLTYRLPGEHWRAGPFAPLQDAQRAFRLIRADSARFGVDPTRLSGLGFSAGGHLLGMASVRSRFQSYRPVDAIDHNSAAPDAAALIYPVITLEPPYGQNATRRMLIGDHPSPAASAEWSVQTHVRRNCPPIFLAQAVDDPISNPANTLIMADACRRAGVPVELHRLAGGGHGFGMGQPGTPAANWPNDYAAWLARIGELSP